MGQKSDSAEGGGGGGGGDAPDRLLMEGVGLSFSFFCFIRRIDSV